MKTRTAVILKSLFYAAVFVFAARYAVRNAPALSGALDSMSTSRVALAAIPVLLGYLARIKTWRGISGGLGMRVGIREDARSWLLSFLGRYIPGNAGLVAVRLTSYPGVPKGRIVAATIVEYGLTLGSAALMVLAGMPWLSGVLPGLAPVVVTIFAVAVLVVSSPWFFTRAYNLFMKLVGRPPLETIPTTGRHMSSVLYAVLASTLHGLAFALILGAQPDATFPRFLLTASSGYFVGGLAGVLFILSPAGIGVREAMTVAALGPVFGQEKVLLAAGVMRGLTVVAELFLFVVAEVVSRRGGRRREPIPGIS
ncbi:MAG TPA: lysylphosphatidylglycerol synthase domain-containing protein [Candidatus Fermentibacter daniensis]|nr:lysylphosphatidylglycerol synthase domain-containing protein [Candidatus Fermentibacter daniensis]